MGRAGSDGGSVFRLGGNEKGRLGAPFVLSGGRLYWIGKEILNWKVSMPGLVEERSALER